MLCVLFFSYKSPGDPEYVEYTKFSDDIEAIFTIKELEKMPLRYVEQFQLDAAEKVKDPLIMTDEMKKCLDVCMHRVAEKVGENWMLKLYS